MEVGSAEVVTIDVRLCFVYETRRLGAWTLPIVHWLQLLS